MAVFRVPCLTKMYSSSTVNKVIPMRHITNIFSWRARVLLGVVVAGLACGGAHAQVTILGAQYHPDQMFPFGCYWNPDAYPNCPTIVGGATVHVYIKNTGASAVTINDATLAGYSLTTVIKTETGSGLGFAQHLLLLGAKSAGRHSRGGRAGLVHSQPDE